ncbi:hypothetical protein Btru_017697 [Bulinus truncatus]|nr:hypothetical protein Btru_017697 [Bulinus truncatus]
MESLPGKSLNKSDKKWFQVLMPCKKCRKRFLYKFRIVSENCDEFYYCSRVCCHDDNISLKKNSSFHNASKISPAKNCQVSSEFSKGEEIRYFQEKGTDRPEGTIVTCLHCGKTCDDSVVCADCKYVHYCTPDCLLKDEALHQEKCAFAVLFNYIDDTLLHGQTYTHLKYQGLTEETNASPLLCNLVHEFAPFIAGPLVSLNRPVIIVQIVGPYPHSWRDAVFVQRLQ